MLGTLALWFAYVVGLHLLAMCAAMFLLLVLWLIESRAPMARAVYRLIAIDEPDEKVERELGKLLPEHIKSFSWQRKKEPGLAHRTRATSAARINS